MLIIIKPLFLGYPLRLRDLSKQKSATPPVGEMELQHRRPVDISLYPAFGRGEKANQYLGHVCLSVYYVKGS